jgi:hypothetical protein
VSALIPLNTCRFQKRREDFFTIEEFGKLRRPTTEGEKRAFFCFLLVLGNAYVAQTHEER